ncbi:MAG: hypothetical protein ACYC54_15355 [Sedimentisphaerales bacterium]
MNWNKPLCTIYYMAFLNCIILGVGLAAKWSKAESAIQFISGIPFRTTISLTMSLIFLYCYARNIALAWHIAFWYVFFGIPIIIFLNPSHKSISLNIEMQVDLFLGVFWLIYSGYMLYKRKAYMDYIKDMTNRDKV